MVKGGTVVARAIPRAVRNVSASMLLGAFGLAACGSPSASTARNASATTPRPAANARGAAQPGPGRGQPTHGSRSSTGPAAKTPRVNVYAATIRGLDVRVRDVTPRVYVPNSDEGTVSVIDPKTYTVLRTFTVGKNPQHIGPSWDLTSLYVSNDLGNSLTPIDPRTALAGPAIAVTDPYNLYYTPEGGSAIVVAERLRRLDFRDPHTWQLRYSIAISHKGANHLDFSADGSYFLISCEFSGWVVKVDMATRRVAGELEVKGEPIDVKLSPDGTVFYVANMSRAGVSIIDPATMTEVGFVRTGLGAHGLYPSRDTTRLYVSNRHANSVSVIDFATRKVVDTWRFTGTPDMGSVSADGKELWLSGRYSQEIYVLDTTTGTLTHRIPVGRGPHGLTFFPQPGRYSLGHTGNYR